MSVTITSWNINGLRSTPSDTLQHLTQDCDMLLLQEVRLASAHSSPASWPSRRGTSWLVPSERAGQSGVAAWVREGIEVRHFPNPLAGTELGRSQLIATDELAVLNVYVPHGRRDLSQLSIKHTFMTSLWAFVHNWTGKPLIIVGDLNIALDERDGARSAAYASGNKSAIFRPELSRQLQAVLDLGYKDAMPGDKIGSSRYTWWPYAYSARHRGVGWRLDYILVPSTVMLGHPLRVLQDVTGSDHCPIQATVQLCVEGSSK